MTTAEDIRNAIEQLAAPELARFRAWFETFDAARFDDAIGPAMWLRASSTGLPTKRLPRTGQASPREL